MKMKETKRFCEENDIDYETIEMEWLHPSEEEEKGE